MFVSSITNRGSTPALVKTLAFNEAKVRTIAENVANAGTPGYKAKQLDRNEFQRSLRQAFIDRGGDPNKQFSLPGTDQIETDDFGRLIFEPTELPTENVLSHDGTNVSIEHQMSELAKTSLSQEVATALLRGKFDGLRKAIRGHA